MGRHGPILTAGLSQFKSKSSHRPRQRRNLDRRRWDIFVQNGRYFV